MMSAEEALASAKAKVRADYKNVGLDSEKLADRICQSFQNAYDKPPVEEFQQILRKNVTEDEVRVTLFAPQEEQVKFYPVLLLAGCQPEVRNLEESHPLVRMKALVLSTMFLLHRFSWKNFLEEFVIRGGLTTLAEMLDEPNLYFRGQVVEMFLTITDSDQWDWFTVRTDALGRTLHIRLLELSEDTGFLSKLVSNRKHSFPGGSMRCLQLLAFWLSWVRAMYTKNQQLILSSGLLAELRAWSEEGPVIDSSIDVSESDGIIETDDSTPDEEALAEEIKLATTLFNDFSKEQFQRRDDELSEGSTSAGQSPTHRNNASAADVAVEEMNVRGISRPDVDDMVKEQVTEAFSRIDDKIEFKSFKDTTNKPEPSREELEAAEKARVAEVMRQHEEKLQARAGPELREFGNAAFGRGDYLEARKLYDYALNSIDNGNVGDATVESLPKLRAALHFNSAACLWKMYQRKHGVGNSGNPYMEHSLAQRTKDITTGELLLSCEKHCKYALAEDPMHFKASYRLGAVYLAQSRASEALRVVEAGLSSITATATDNTVETSYTQLRELRTRCMAANLLHTDADEGNAPMVPKKTAGVLAALQRRKQREANLETHALSSSYEPFSEEMVKSEAHEPAAKASKKKNDVDASAGADVSAYFGSDNVYTGFSSKAKGTKASSKRESVDDKPAAGDGSQKEAEKRKAKRAAEKKASRKRLAEAMASMKKALLSLEKEKFSEDSISSHKDAIVSSLEAIWTTAAGSKGKFHSLSSAYTDTSSTLEEPHVSGLVILSEQLLRVEETREVGLRCAIELSCVERFKSVVSMSKFGSVQLETCCNALRNGLAAAGGETAQRAAAAFGS